ncbi:MAG: mechanosensitive ion channel protein MscS [Ignavibacteriae bacterium HGW-Ignavibacteriae-4]|jgi:small-conductance mechanosensitive channel|nr:MAG: mechanosensitive ion channel protein MscS [Ignavibacteriae bacterium HGW-Ignavibacteriae-4]
MTKTVLNKFLSYDLFSIYDVDIQIKDFAFLLLFLMVIKILSKILNRIVFKYSKRDRGSTIAVYKLISYLLWVIGVSFYLNFIGFDVTFLVASSAALLVGIGIGLQQTFNDLISGIILLFEGSIKIGDVVVVDGEFKKIRNIGLRTSTAESFDNSIVIIPNSKIVTEKVINYDNGVHPVRFNIKIDVAYGSDTTIVKKLLLEIAKTEELVLETPEPFVMFDNIGESAYNFRLCIFIQYPLDGFVTQSNIRYKIIEEFNKNHISIPFPQRDININKQSLREFLSDDN